MPKSSSKTKIGIIGAMKVEVKDLISAMANKKKTRIARMDFYEGRIEGVRVVVVQSGIAKVHMAVCAQILIDRFGVTHLINTGVAGSLNKNVNIEDVVVSTELVHHDLDATPVGFELGEVPGCPVYFPSHKKLTKFFMRVIGDVAQTISPQTTVHQGRIASGERFVAEAADKRRIVKHFDALATEMEGASLAQVAWLNRIPFVVLRSISDNANEESPLDYPTFEKRAAKLMATCIREALKEWND